MEKCVDKIVKLLVRRRAQIDLPWYLGPLFWLDEIVLRYIGDTILRWTFPRV